MKENAVILGIKIFRIALITVLILLIPLVLMLFVDEMNWGPADFAITGTLLFGTGVTYELIARNFQNRKHRIAIAIALGLALAVVWVELAVGIFD